MVIIDKKTRELGGVAYIESDGNNFILSDYDVVSSGFGSEEIIDNVFIIDKVTTFQMILSSGISLPSNIESGATLGMTLALYFSEDNPYFPDYDEAQAYMYLSLRNPSDMFPNPYTYMRGYELPIGTYKLRMGTYFDGQVATPTEYSFDKIRFSMFTIMK